MTPAAQDVAVMSLAAGADLASTHHALRSCPSCYEAVPWMREPAGAVVVKAGMVAGGALICRKMRRSGHGRAAKVMRWAMVAAWMGLAAHNMSLAGQR